MGTQTYNYTPDLSVEAARYSPHDYLVCFSAQTFGWTLSVARRIEDGRPVNTTSEERETCIMITQEQALDLIDTWNFSLQAEAEERSIEAELLAAYRKEMREWREQEAQKQIEVDYRKWQHDQRMMWFRENDGTNQCIPAWGWAILLQRIAA